MYPHQFHLNQYMTKMKIEVVSKELLRPSFPTPSQLRDFKLSFIDERIPSSYSPLILYFSFKEDENIKQNEMVGRLKSSLADALVQFYPLAGRMKGQIFVDCNDEGILYVEAQACGNVGNIVRSPESGVLDQLTPFITGGFVSTVEEPLAVQITSFNLGGITIGMCISHRIADHYSLSSFTKYWAAVARRDDPNLIPPPLFNSAALFPPRNTSDFRPNIKSPSVQPLAPKVTMKSFLFTPAAVNSLKLQITTATSVANPSRVEAVTAFLWSRCAAAYELKQTDLSVACHPVSIRGKVPSLKEESFGNLFQMMFAESCGGTSWVQLAEKLRASFGALDVEKLLGEKGFEAAKENFMGISKYLSRGNVEVFRFSSLCRFPVYEADFGWGKPAWVSYAGFPSKNCIFLFECVHMPGGVEAWIAMTDQAMERLELDVDF